MKLPMLFFAITLLAQAGTVALAQSAAEKGATVAGVQVTSPWARASARTARAGAAYATLENTGATPDKLLSASSPVADKVTLHTHIRDGAIMRMREVQSIEVGPYSKVRLQPGGLHLMLMGLKGPLEKDARFPLTLVFEAAGPITVEVTVEGPGSMGPADMPGHGGGMKH